MNSITTMKLKLDYLLLFLFLVTQLGYSQVAKLTNTSKISVLTCGAGSELYSAFGHTAIRIQDATLGVDWVYNYGTFDFDKPNFYVNFAKGKLIYSLSASRMDSFLLAYQAERRWVKEQILDLDLTERNRLFTFLEINRQPENRDYLYDPIFNNCSSIVGDILEEQYGNAIAFGKAHITKESSFRQLVREHISSNSWSDFGIDLAWGSVVDRKATPREHSFLPYYAMKELNQTTKSGKPIVLRERTILEYPENSKNALFFNTPFFWFTILFIAVVALTYFDQKHHIYNKWLDFSLFFLTGIMGCIMFILWFATDHVSTAQNFNVFWAFPLNIIVAFSLLFSNKLPPWLPNYLITLLICFAITLIIWLFRIQLFSPVIIPIILTLTVRYFVLLRKSKTTTQ